MGRQLWIADALRAEGLHVVEVDGWHSRGNASFDPRGVVCHHTASSAGGGNIPTLKLLINGRSDLPGPLAQVGLARNGTVYVIASGRANHAGSGGWGGMSGNSSVFGIEAENDGRGEAWPNAQLNAYVRVCVALLKGIKRDQGSLCGHKEWAPMRKIDPTFDMDWFRGQVWLHLIGAGGGTTPTPTPTPTPAPGSNWKPESGTTLERWEYGTRVKAWQHDLNAVASQNLTEDGYFGEGTHNSTVNFQTFFGLHVDGVVGPQTKGLMDYLKAPRPPWPGRYLKVTSPLMRGDDIKRYQQRLKELGANDLVADGVYGARTRDVTKFCQGGWGLTVDGIVGKATWDRAFR